MHVAKIAQFVIAMKHRLGAPINVTAIGYVEFVKLRDGQQTAVQTNDGLSKLFHH
jgi:hypothetical protein